MLNVLRATLCWSQILWILEQMDSHETHSDVQARLSGSVLQQVTESLPAPEVLLWANPELWPPRRRQEAREWRISLRGLVKYHFIINLTLEVHLHETHVFPIVVGRCRKKGICLTVCECWGWEHQELFCTVVLAFPSSFHHGSVGFSTHLSPFLFLILGK